MNPARKTPVGSKHLHFRLPAAWVYTIPVLTLLVSGPLFALAFEAPLGSGSGVRVFELNEDDPDRELLSFEVTEPSLIRLELEAEGFDPLFAVVKDQDWDDGEFRLEAGQKGRAGQALELTARLDESGMYEVQVLSSYCWSPDPGYRLSWSLDPLREVVGAQVYNEIGPLDAETGETKAPAKVTLEGIELSSELIGEETVLVETDDPEMVFGAVGKEGALIEPADRASRRLDLDFGRVDQVVAIAGFGPQEPTVRAVRGVAWQPAQTVVGRIDESSPPGFEVLGNAHVRRLDVPDDVELHIAAGSMEAYLDLVVLDSAGKVIGFAWENETDGMVEVTIPADGPRPAFLLIRGRDDIEAEFLLSLTESQVQTAVLNPDEGVAEPFGENPPGSVRRYDFPFEDPGDYVVRSRDPSQMLAVDGLGGWIALSVGESHGGDLAGRELGAGKQVLEIGPDEPAPRWLLVNGPSGEPIQVERRTEVSEELDGGYFEYHGVSFWPRPGTHRWRHEVHLEEGDVLEVKIDSIQLAEVSLTLLDPGGTPIGETESSRNPRMVGLAKVAGIYTLDVVADGMQEAISFAVSLRRGRGEIRQEQLDLLYARPIDLLAPRDGFIRRASIQAPANHPLLVEWRAEDCDLAELETFRADGARANLVDNSASEDDRVILVTKTGPDGRLELAASCDEPTESSSLTVWAINAPPLPNNTPETALRNSDLPEAPGFTFINQDGLQQELSNLRGRVVLLDFWASWCGPCRLTLPEIEKIHQNHTEKGLVVLGVSSDDREAVEEMATRIGLTFHTIDDRDGQIKGRYGVDAIPRTVLIDRQGRVAADLSGVPDDDTLLSRLVLAELGPGEGVDWGSSDGSPESGVDSARAIGQRPPIDPRLERSIELQYGIGREVDVQQARGSAMEALQDGNLMASLWIAYRQRNEPENWPAPLDDQAVRDAYSEACERAEVGDPLAAWLAGISLIGGEGCLADPEQARHRFEQAVRAGFLPAFISMYWFHMDGLGDEPASETTAFNWARRCAEQGVVACGNNLGLAYLEGLGVEADPVEAAFWFRSAAEKGEPAAMFNIGDLLQRGNGVEQNQAEGLLWIQRSAESGHLPAIRRLETTLKGTVQTTAEEPVPGAAVLLIAEDQSFDLKAVTDHNGAFTFEACPSGHYLLAAGTESEISSGSEVHLERGRMKEVELVLSLTVPDDRMEAHVMTCSSRPDLSLSLSGYRRSFENHPPTTSPGAGTGETASALLEALMDADDDDGRDKAAAALLEAGAEAVPALIEALRDEV